MRDPMRTGEGVPWRESVLRGVLTVAALLAVPTVVIAVIGQAPRTLQIDTVAMLAVGVLMPIFRLAPGIPLAARATGAIVPLVAVPLLLFTRRGFAPGAFLALAVAAVLATVYFGRRAGLVLVALVGAAFVIIGALVTRGSVVVEAPDLDPLVMRNWLRIAFVTTLLAALLTLMVDVVIRQVEDAARATREALVQLAALHDKLEVTKEDERRFLARELHDDLGQTLTVLKFRIQVGGGPGAGEAVALVDELIARVRKLSVGLRPPLLDEVGLVPALRAYLEGQTAATGIAMVLHADPPDGGADRLSPDLEIACFRVVQESITNVLRHASARRIDVDVVQQPNTIRIAIRDDGRGFDAASTLRQAAAGGHLGVVGMRERVRGRGGMFALDSRPGAGTRVSIELPVASAPGAAPTAT